MNFTTKIKSSKRIDASTIPGLPSDITLRFSKLSMRYHIASDGIYFFCTIIFHGIQDPDGGELEVDFMESPPYEEAEIADPYYVPLHDHQPKTLPDSTSLQFKDITEMGKRMLILDGRIKGTPFYGRVLIDQDHYTINFKS